MAFLLLRNSTFNFHCYIHTMWSNASLEIGLEVVLWPFVMSCAKDYKGHSLMQISFAEPPNTTETTTSRLRTNQNSTSDYDRQFLNLCDRRKMLKVVHGNQSDNHRIWSDTQLSIPLLSLSLSLSLYIYISYSTTAVLENTWSSPSPVHT